ncbi:MAG: radical SAM protein [Elusimicrobia bacterium]|nr:radical SAM protein [Elusimicrobiota bacterium]
MNATMLLNKFSFRLRPFFSGVYGTSWFIAFTAFYFRTILPFIRRFVPLYGVTVVLSMSYKCQCSCAHCGVGKKAPPPGGELTSAEILKFIDDLGRLGGACVHFFGGEPLVVPQLPEFVARTRALGMMASVDTNGLLLDEAMVLRLKAAGIERIRVSLDSPREADHDVNRGVPGCWRKAVDGLRLCAKHGIPANVSIYATRENLANGDFEKMIALAREIGVGVRFLSSIQSGKWKDKDVPLTPEEIAKLRGLVAPDVCWETEFLQHKNVPFWCNSMIGNKFDVSAFGDVLACCYLPAAFGNIRKEPLETIVKRMWSSEMFKKGSDHFDCPMNDRAFTSRNEDQLNSPRSCA